MNEIVALLESLRPILERWYLLLFAIVLVTLLGIPARVLVGALAALLRVPAVFTRAEIDPPLRRATPTAPYRLLRNLRDYFRPVLDRPGRALTGAAGGGFYTARNAANRPGAAITRAVVGLFSPPLAQGPTPARNRTERLRAPDSPRRGLAQRFGGIAPPSRPPLMPAGTALSPGGAIAVPCLAWTLVVGALALGMLGFALVLGGVTGALPPLAVLLGGILR